MATVKRYSFAGVPTSIEGEGTPAEALRDAWSKYEDSSLTDESIRIIVHDSLKSLDIDADFYSLSQNIRFNRREFYVKSGNVAYKVTDLFTEDEKSVIELYYIKQQNLKHKIKSISPFFSITNETEVWVNNVSNYSCLLWLLAIALLKHSRVFIHSGMLADSRGGVVFSGTSGCGKTSSMFQLLSKGNWKYISEDFGVLDSEGFIYSVPKKAAIYASDVKFGNPILKKAIQSFDWLRRFRWYCSSKAGMNPMYRFSIGELLKDDQVATKEKLHSLVFLARTYSKDVHVEEVGKEEIIERVTMASFREIKTIYEVLCNIHAVGGVSYQNYYPKLTEVIDKYKAVLRQGLLNVKCSLVLVPKVYGPTEINDALDFLE